MVVVMMMRKEGRLWVWEVGLLGLWLRAVLVLVLALGLDLGSGLCLRLVLRGAGRSGDGIGKLV